MGRFHIFVQTRKHEKTIARRGQTPMPRFCLKKQTVSRWHVFTKHILAFETARSRGEPCAGIAGPRLVGAVIRFHVVVKT